MAFLNETGLATFLSYLKAWARATFASKTDTQTIEGATTFSQTIGGSISGNAATATKLATARTINGVAFDGSANITVADSTKLPLSGGSLTGAVNSSSIFTAGAFYIKNASVTKGTNPPSGTTYFWTFGAEDKNGTSYANNSLGMFETSLSSSGLVKTYMRAMKNAAATGTPCEMGVAYDTANSTGYTYAPTPATADNSTKIATTAFVKAQGYVANTGEQSINSLIVTASGNVKTNSNANALYISGGTGSSGAEGAYMILVGSTNTGGSAGCFFLRAATSTGNVKTFKGFPDGTLTWNGQNIQTSSDERLKTTLSSVPDAVLDAWEDVQWGEFQYLDAVERKGESARLHLGLIAQRVKAVFEAHGLDACPYGILCYEEKEDLWTVRYAEALAMEAACQRRRADRLEARIAALEEALR